jgi:uncharacterized membrane protein
MFAIDVVSRIVHVSTAILLVGGSAFVYLILLGAAKTLTDESHQALREAIRERWKRVVHAGIALFLLSGFYNFWRALGAHEGDGLYHGLVGTKILLALVVFFIASALVGKSAKLEFMRRQQGKWLSIMLTLAAIIVCISGYVKVRGPQPASGEEAAATAALDI